LTAVLSVSSHLVLTFLAFVIHGRQTHTWSVLLPIGHTYPVDQSHLVGLIYCP